MAKVISIFNNKGGVGKTTYLFHIAHLLCERQLKVLMVDCDSQCNLTAYSMTDKDIEDSWKSEGNSIFRVIEPVYEGFGDVRKRRPFVIDKDKGLFIVPGDLSLSLFEDRLGDSWNGARGGSKPDLRIQSAIYRYIDRVISKGFEFLMDGKKEYAKIDIVLIDLGPNLGALNRAVLSGSDYFIVPVSPDLFSIKGTENLGNKLLLWQKEWKQCNTALESDDLDIPQGKPEFVGYVIQHHNIRANNDEGMTQGWQIFANRLKSAIEENIINKLRKNGQVIERDNWNFNLGQIPNLHSLIPYSLNARKPVFSLVQSDGARGAHFTKARDSKKHFKDIIDAIVNLV